MAVRVVHEREHHEIRAIRLEGKRNRGRRVLAGVCRERTYSARKRIPYFRSGSGHAELAHHGTRLCRLVAHEIRRDAVEPEMDVVDLRRLCSGGDGEVLPHVNHLLQKLAYGHAEGY